MSRFGGDNVQTYLFTVENDDEMYEFSFLIEKFLDSFKNVNDEEEIYDKLDMFKEEVVTATLRQIIIDDIKDQMELLTQITE